MKEGFKEKLGRFVTVVLVIGVAAVGLVTAWPNYLRSRSLKRQDAELAERIDEKKREIARLKEYQNRFRTDSEFVENIARQNRRVFPGELVFKFED
jgi:cell division protein FtsB